MRVRLEMLQPLPETDELLVRVEERVDAEDPSWSEKVAFVEEDDEDEDDDSDDDEGDDGE